MSNMADRLRKAREARGFAHASEAAKALGVPYPTYAGHENGSRGFLDDIDRYAQFFGIRAEWLRSGIGPMKSGHRDPFQAQLEALSPEKRQQVYQFIEFLRGNRDAAE